MSDRTTDDTDEAGGAETQEGTAERTTVLPGERITKALERATTRRREYAGGTWTDEMFREQRDRDLEVRTLSSATVMRATLITLLLAMLLTSGKLVEIAERQPLGGDTRGFWLPLAERVDRTANFLSLNRPADLIADVRGSGKDPAQTVDDIRDVIDDPVLPAPTTTTATGGPTTTDVPATTTTPPLRSVTAADPLRVLFVGDSQAQYPAESLILRVAERGLPATVEFEAEISTGLARPDVFNWPALLREATERASPPEAYVLLFGANDNQDMVDGDGTVVTRLSPEWRTEYATRVAITMDVIAGEGRHVIWVGQPPMRDGSLDDAMRVVDEIARAEADARPGVTFLDIRGRFSGPDGGYSTDLADASGNQVTVRVAADGVHLNPTGAAWLSDLIADEISRLWGLS